MLINKSCSWQPWPVISCPGSCKCSLVGFTIGLAVVPFLLSVFSKNSRFVRENFHPKDLRKNLTDIFCIFL